MIINGINTPYNMHGRAFPYKDSGTQFEGVCVIHNIQYRMVHWLNQTKEGRPYIRTVFEEIPGE